MPRVQGLLLKAAGVLGTRLGIKDGFMVWGLGFKAWVWGLGIRV